MGYSEIMDQFTIEHGDDWARKYEQARLYNRLPPFCSEEEFLRMALHHAQEKGYKPGYAAVLYKELFRQWPDGYDWMKMEPLEPSEDFQDWLSAKDERMKISQKRKKSSSRRK